MRALATAKITSAAVVIARSGSPPLCSYPFIVMVFVFLRVLFSRPTAKPHERCARPRGTRGEHRAKARRRDRDIAPYRNGTAPWDRTTGHAPRDTCGAHDGTHHVWVMRARISRE